MVKIMNKFAKQNFRVYNKSSERMNEIQDGSIDLVITSPPYNIGTGYGSFSDNLAFEDYMKMISNVINECYRVQTPKGKLIVEVADSIRIGGLYVQLAGLFQSICLKKGYFLERRDINFIRSKDNCELPDHAFDENYSTTSNGHSNCHQILVFSKEKNKSFRQGRVLYLNYEESAEHPCPFPQKTIEFILNNYFTPGDRILDPFMGTANLGREVLRLGGYFFGYEIDKGFYQTALKKLKGETKNGKY
jgi:DNA modification methylase